MPGPRSRWTESQLQTLAIVDPGGELYAAVDTLKAQAKIVPKKTSVIGEAEVLGALGVVRGDSVLAAIESQVSSRVVRLLQSRGIDVCHSETVEVLDSLVAGGHITVEDRTDLLALGYEIVSEWTGLRAADLLLAREEYGGA